MKALYAGKVPDIELELERTDKLYQSWQRAVDAWEYVGELFREASRNIRYPIAVMPLLAFLTIRAGVVPSYPTFSDLCKGARVYQFYVGWLRELHVGLELAAHGRVAKRLVDDVSLGIDWYYCGKSIAVGHAGRMSREYWLRRKASKCKADYILTASSSGSGLHLVSSSDISAIILANNSASLPLT